MDEQIVKFASSHAEPYPLQVEGESNYRDNIEAVSGYTGASDGINEDDFIALLILEEDNINDVNAVRVEIENKTVGYLSRPAAKKYRQKLIELNIPNITGQCYASIRGGFEKKDGSLAEYGIRLDMIIDELSIYKAPVKIVSILPPAPAEVKPSTPPINLFMRLIKWTVKSPSNSLAAILGLLFLIVAVIMLCQIIGIVL